jgi:hypothetical protein
MATTMAPEVITDPISVVVDLVAERETGLDRADIEAAVASVAGGRAKTPPLGSGVARQARGAGRRTFPGAPRSRGSADRRTQGRGRRDLVAGLR